MHPTADFIRGKLLLTSSQIDFYIDEIREHFGVLTFITTEMICKFLELNFNQSTATMVGVAMRRDARVVCKRIAEGRIFVFVS